MFFIFCFIIFCIEINLLTSAYLIICLLSFSYFNLVFICFSSALTNYIMCTLFSVFVIISMNCKILRLLWQTGVINNFCQLIDPEGVRQELSHLKSLNVDGVAIDCWWGIVEGWSPQKYVWSGYRELFNIIQEFKLNLQVDSQDLIELCIWYLA